MDKPTTHEQVLEATDPQLIELAAQVMRWKRLQKIGYEEESGWFVEESPGHYLQVGGFNWNPPAKMADAFMLVEKLRDGETEIRVWKGFVNNLRDQDETDPMWAVSYVLTNLTPRAITIAAILAWLGL